VSLEQGPLSPLNTIEELLGRKSIGSCLESREYGHRDLSCWSCCTLYPQKLVLSSPTSGGRSAGIIRLRTQAASHKTCVVHVCSCRFIRKILCLNIHAPKKLCEPMPQTQTSILKHCDAWTGCRFVLREIGYLFWGLDHSSPWESTSKLQRLHVTCGK
jgi:hypothetical protein